ncbi:MAG: methylenetetrahydrofolate reductase [NAD(P)H] [Prevotella sp.]|jgi:methylenetetrahydrofolate reductase (NADPH)|nr:methylenetetrahydrofolate reductase [NAD(P)H] [Prevotella sp.]
MKLNLSELLQKSQSKRYFSFEVLPPIKGNSTHQLFSTIDKLKEFHPLFINITTHHSEYVYRELDNGLIDRQRIRRRPGTIAIAAAIQNRYGIPIQPHIICSGTTKEEIEYELLDLQFLGINNILLLRGDKAREDKSFKPTPGGYTHTTELIKQVNQFNNGFFVDGTPMKHPEWKFDFGVACYPEKHEEAPNLEEDMKYLKEKQDLGAEYAVTQLFYDNEKYYSFVKKAKEMGITIPIIPGIKPLTKLRHLTIVPKTFHVDIPDELAKEALKCKTDEEVSELGVEWTINQVEDLYKHGVQNVHFYTVSAVDSIQKVVKRLL